MSRKSKLPICKSTQIHWQSEKGMQFKPELCSIYTYEIGKIEKKKKNKFGRALYKRDLSYMVSKIETI